MRAKLNRVRLFLDAEPGPVSTFLVLALAALLLGAALKVPWSAMP